MVCLTDDIQLSADTSQAIEAIGRIGGAFERAARDAGASSKSITTAMRGMERAISGVVGSAVLQQSAQRATTQAMQQGTQAITGQATSLELLRRARARANQQLGVKENSAGRLINASTGRFADSAMSKTYQTQVDHNIRALQTQASLEERLGAMRLRNANNAEIAGRQQANHARTQTDAYQAQQRMLERAFNVKPVTQMTSRMQRLGGVLQRVPPATWARAIGRGAQAMSQMSNSARYALYDVSMSAGVAGAALAGFGVMAISAAIKHERAFANVERTTQTSAEGYKILRRELEVMATELPVTYEEITNIASAAGQLGISTSGVTDFTSTVAKLSSTTNLTSDAAGIALARFRAFFAEVGEDQGLNVTERTFSNLASSILKVGINSIATETGIVNVSTQIASMAQYAGYTANQTIGLAGALSSIGVAPELSRGTITRTFSLIGNAVAKGGEQLDKFAELSGLSASQFKAAWGTDQFSGVFTRMMNGLYDVTQSGEDANLMLMELGFNSVRDRPLLLRLAGAANEAGEAGGLLAQTMSDAYDGWVANAELAIQYEKIAGTTAARIQVLGQAFEQLFASMGEESGNFVGDLAEGMTGLIKNMEAFTRTDLGKWLGGAVVQSALVLGGFLLLVSAGSRVIASLQGMGTAYAEMAAKGTGALTRLGAAGRLTSLGLGLVGLVATVASLAIGFAGLGIEMSKAKPIMSDVGSLWSAMVQDAENGARGAAIYSSSLSDSMTEAAAAATQAEILGKVLDRTGSATAAAADDGSAMAEVLFDMRGAGGAAEEGLNRAAKGAQRLRGVVGDATRDLIKQDLLRNEDFTGIFDPATLFGGRSGGKKLTAADIGMDMTAIDPIALFEESLRSGKSINQTDLARRWAKAYGIDEFEVGFVGGVMSKQTTAEFDALFDMAGRVSRVIGDTTPELQAQANAQLALNGANKTAAQIYEEYADGVTSTADAMSNLTEEQQANIGKTAESFAKFVDMSNLIGLTQSRSEQSADDFAKTWADAYGGTSFSLEQYLQTFRGAADEQSQFLVNLQQLTASGLIDDGIIQDLTAMGPEANRLVQAMVNDLNNNAGAGLAEFTALWGKTGFDSMVQMAIQAELGQQYVNAVFNKLGVDGLHRFNSLIASGVGVNDALRELGVRVEGTPITPVIKKPTVPDLTAAERIAWMERNRLTINARVNVPNVSGMHYTTGKRPFASGGYVSGPGTGTSDSIPAMLSNGEFVMTAKATRNIGISNLYAMMHAAQGGSKVPRGRGYATGGLVGSGGGGGITGPTMVYLSPEDRELLRSIQPVVRIGNRDIARANQEASFRSTREGVG